MHLTEVVWSPPGGSDKTGAGGGSSSSSATAKAALECAKTVSKNFERDFAKFRDSEREQSVPKFDGEEAVISAHAIRLGRYTVEHELRTIRIIMDLHKGSFGGKSDHVRSRFADRSIDGHFCIRYLQPGLLDTVHAQKAATEMAREARILMNLAPHPNIIQCYGSNSDGLNALLGRGRKRFFMITDRISETLSDRIQRWKVSGTTSAPAPAPATPKIGDRIEVATDIASALLHVHGYKLVYYLHPDKLGFDTRHDRIKLVDFGQACPEGSTKLADSLTTSDSIRTLSYTAPEVLCNAPATIASDVYAFGMLLWELMSLEHPFESYDRPTHFQKVVRENERPAIPSSKEWPRPVCEIVENCWDPSLRPTLSMVNESLEVALLFSEHEKQEVKDDFRAVRRQSSSKKALVREASSRRFSAHHIASPRGNGDRTPSRPRRVVRHKSEEPARNFYASPSAKASPRSDVDPQRSSQSTPGGVNKRVKKAKGAVRVSRSTSLRVDGDAPDETKTRRVIRVRSGSLEKGERVPLVLAKLGIKLDDEEMKMTMTTQTPTSGPSCSSGSDEEGGQRAVRSRRSKKDDSQDTDEAGAPKTPPRRSSKRDERQSVPGSEVITPKTRESRPQLRRSNSREMVPHTPTPRRRVRHDKKTSPTTSSSSSSPSGGSGRKTPPRTSSKNTLSNLPPPVRGQLYRCNSFESVFSTEQDKKLEKGQRRRPTPAQNLQRYASDRNLTTNSADLLAELVGNLNVPKHNRVMPIVPSSCPPASPQEPPVRRMQRRGSA